MYFIMARRATGDYHNIKPTEATKLIAQEYKTLSAEELKVCFLVLLLESVRRSMKLTYVFAQKYQDEAAQDRVRYQQEFKTVYNRDSKPKATRAKAS